MQDFRVLLRVRFQECDAQGVVFNARYADYVDIAVTEFFRYTLGGHNKMKARNLDNQVVSLTIDWKSSLRFDDVMAISMKTTRVGNTSFNLVADIVQHPSGVPVATASVTYVMVRPDENLRYHKTPVPDDIREMLLAGPGPMAVDFSGPAIEG